MKIVYFFLLLFLWYMHFTLVQTDSSCVCTLACIELSFSLSYSFPSSCLMTCVCLHQLLHVVYSSLWQAIHTNHFHSLLLLLFRPLFFSFSSSSSCSCCSAVSSLHTLAAVYYTIEKKLIAHVREREKEREKREERCYCFFCLDKVKRSIESLDTKSRRAGRRRNSPFSSPILSSRPCLLAPMLLLILELATSAFVHSPKGTFVHRCMTLLIPLHPLSHPPLFSSLLSTSHTHSHKKQSISHSHRLFSCRINCNITHIHHCNYHLSVSCVSFSPSVHHWSLNILCWVKHLRVLM